MFRFADKGTVFWPVTLRQTDPTGEEVAETTIHVAFQILTRKELRDRREAARIFLEEALKDADIYVKGERIQSLSRDIKARINDALSRLVGQVYHKLTYIDTPASDADIRGLRHCAWLA